MFIFFQSPDRVDGTNCGTVGELLGKSFKMKDSIESHSSRIWNDLINSTDQGCSQGAKILTHLTGRVAKCVVNLANETDPNDTTSGPRRLIKPGVLSY